MEKLKNCTPHPIVIRVGENDSTFLHSEYSGIIPRVATIETPGEGIGGFPCVSQTMGEVEGLPAPEAGVFLIVSALVFGASDRDDLIAPDTGKTCIRDDQGRIMAVTRFIRKRGMK